MRNFLASIFSCEPFIGLVLAKVELVVHTLLFGSQIALVVFVRGNDDRNDLVDLQAIALQSYPFERIVGHQAHVFDAHFANDACTYAVVALIDTESQPYVGIDRIESFVLQFVGSDLVVQADAA